MRLHLPESLRLLWWRYPVVDGSPFIGARETKYARALLKSAVPRSRPLKKFDSIPSTGHRALTPPSLSPPLPPPPPPPHSSTLSVNQLRYKSQPTWLPRSAPPALAQFDEEGTHAPRKARGRTCTTKSNLTCGFVVAGVTLSHAMDSLVRERE